MNAMFIKPIAFVFRITFVSVKEVKGFIEREKASQRHREKFYVMRKRLNRKNDELV